MGDIILTREDELEEWIRELQQQKWISEVLWLAKKKKKKKKQPYTKKYMSFFIWIKILFLLA
jgi:hypothetical protein